MCAPPGRRSRIPKTTELVTLSDVRARALARPPWQQARGWPRGAERNSGHVTWDVTGGRSVQSPRTPSSFRIPGLRHFLSAVSSMVLIHAKTERQWYTVVYEPRSCRMRYNSERCTYLQMSCAATVRRGVTVLSRPVPHIASAARHMHLRLSGTFRHHRRTAPLMCGHKKGRRIDDRSSHERRRSHGRSAKVCLSLQDQAAPAQAAHTSPSCPQHPGAGRQRQRTYNSSRWPHGAPPLSLRLLRRRRFEWCIAHTDRILHDW